MQVAMKSPNLSEYSTMEPKKNFVSPVIRSNSRGARFLDLVKNNKLNVSPQLTKRLSMHSKSVRDIMMERNDKKMESPDYLKFSSGTPNLSSSPTSGILSKRKSLLEAPDSPSLNSAKRKRVSFNDPVSTTKEYLITEEEEKSKSNSLIRCLTYEAAEIIEQEDEECENKENIIAVDIKPESQEEFIQIKAEQEDKTVAQNSAIMDHDYDENPQNTDITTSSSIDLNEQKIHKSQNQLRFNDKNEIMDYVAKNFTFNEILDKFMLPVDESLKRQQLIDNIFDKVDHNDVLNQLHPLNDTKQVKMTTEQLEKTSNLINHLSKMMKSNDRVKHKVLDMLSEKHSKDFLSHALQENSVTTVCQKLTIPSIVSYLIHKVNVCDDNEIDFEVNRMNRNIMQHLVKRTTKTSEITDQKEVQEMMKLMFRNMPKIEVLDSVHEFLRSNIIQGPF